MQYKKLASAGDKENIIKLITEYFYGTPVTLEENQDGSFRVHNSKGLIENYRVIVKTSKKWIGPKFIFEHQEF